LIDTYSSCAISRFVHPSRASRTMRSSPRRQRLDADGPVAARSRAGNVQLLAGAGGERLRTTARRRVKTP